MKIKDGYELETRRVDEYIEIITGNLRDDGKNLMGDHIYLSPSQARRLAKQLVQLADED